MPRFRGRKAALTLLLTILLLPPAVVAQGAQREQLNAQAADLEKKGKYTEALTVALQALKVSEATFGPDDAKVAAALNRLAMIYDDLAKYSQAEPLYQRALRIYEKVSGPESAEVAVALNNLGLLYVHQHKYSAAEPLYRRASSIDEKVLGPDKPDFATDLGNLASLYDHEGKFSDAEPLFQRTLSIDEKALGSESPDVAADLRHLAGFYGRQGKYTDAEPLFERALHISEQALGPDAPDVARSLGMLAVNCMRLAEYAKAESLFQRALQIDEKASGPGSIEVATDLNNLSQLYTREAKYDEALPLVQRALRIWEAKLGPDDLEVATGLNNLAQIYSHKSKYAQAEPLYQRSLKIRQKALGQEDSESATVLNNLAGLYEKEGRYADAEPLYQRAMQVRVKIFGSEHIEVSGSFNSLALLYRDQGKYAEAETLAKHAFQIREKTLGPEHPQVAASLNTLAQIYVNQGRYSEAEVLFQREIHIDEKALGLESPSVATDVNNLGQLYSEERKYDKATPLFQRAITIDEKTMGPDHPTLAVDLNNLAVAYENMEKFTEAETLFQRALHINEKAFGPDHPLVATNLNNLAVLYQSQAKYIAAEPLYKRTLRIKEEKLGPNHPGLAKDLNNLATLYDNEGKYTEAEPLFQRSFDNIFQQFQYNFSYMTEKERLGFLDTYADDFPGYFSFVHRYRQKDPHLIGSMYNLLLWEKGFIVGSVADMRRRVEASGDAQAIKLLNQLTAKRTQIAGLLSVNPDDLDLWRKQVDELQTDANDIEKALVARSSAFAEQKKLERATWQQVRDALRPGEAAVEFARFDFYDKDWTGASYYVALVITPDTKDQPEYVVVGEGRQLEGDAITSFQHAVQTRGLSADEDAKLPGAEAYSLIWKPLEQALTGKTRVYISADGVLNQLPLGIIPSPGGKLMMERYDLRLFSSTKDILRAPSSPSAKSALLIGDPLFSLGEQQQLAAIQKIGPAREKPLSLLSNLEPSDQSRDLPSGIVLSPLPWTGVEVNTIAKLLNNEGWKTTTLTRNLALKTAIEQAGNPRVLHLATHGFFLADLHLQGERGPIGHIASPQSRIEDPMLRSGLYFAGADRALAGKPPKDGLDNGVLTALEAGNLNLTGTELVVLSACNTGQGDVKNGEGVFGLRRALQESGAQAVLMSLWPIPDKETLELMQTFYTKWLSGTEKHEALKQAQLETRDKVKNTHDGRDLPYYWGAFVLVGR